MAYHSKYTGAEVDALLDKIAEDNVGDIDSALSLNSENPVMNKVVTEELKNKATKKEVGSLSNTVASNKTTADASIANLSSKAESLQTQFEILESSVITDSELDDLFND